MPTGRPERRVTKQVVAEDGGPDLIRSEEKRNFQLRFRIPVNTTYAVRTPTNTPRRHPPACFVCPARPRGRFRLTVHGMFVCGSFLTMRRAPRHTALLSALARAAPHMCAGTRARRAAYRDHDRACRVTSVIAPADAVVATGLSWSVCCVL